MKRPIAVAIASLVALGIAGFLAITCCDTPSGVAEIDSRDISTPTERLATLQRLIPFDGPADDVAFRIRSVDELLTPGPSSLDACIAIAIPAGSEDAWLAQWRAATPDEAIDLRCATRLAPSWTDLTSIPDLKRYRPSTADPADLGQVRAILPGGRTLLWRIAR